VNAEPTLVAKFSSIDDSFQLSVPYTFQPFTYNKTSPQYSHPDSKMPNVFSSLPRNHLIYLSDLIFHLKRARVTIQSYRIIITPLISC